VAAVIAQVFALPTSPNTTATSTANVALAAAASAMNLNIVARSRSLAGTETPLSGTARVSTPGASKEKKSAADSPEGSFLQLGATSSKSALTTPSLIAAPASALGDGAGNQQVATQFSSGKDALNGLGVTASSSVGTAPVEKKSSMSTDLNIPQAMIGAGTNTVSRPLADVNILLSTNHDFEDALKQVVHIAQLSDLAASRAPTRIAIELQTPPGAIVNVYVSKQDNQYRAQLSTSDPAALSWVQDKIAALRQSDDLGVQVKWLPAQMESNPLSAATTSGNGSNFNSNRDGQNQNDPQPDDRSQSGRQNQAPAYEDLADTEAEAFSSRFAAIGGAA
jgi:hypothetical protein